MADLGVDGRIIIKWILKKWEKEARTGFALAQHRDRWQVLLNAVMNLWVL